MQHMITKILSVWSMSINDSDVQGRIVKEKTKAIKRGWREKEKPF